MRHLLRLSFLVALVALLAPGAALADAIDPEEEVCWDKSVGDACSLSELYEGGGDGACVESTCSRNDYSVGEDGEVEVGSRDEPCLVCDTSATPTNKPGLLARFARCSLSGVTGPRGVLPLASVLLGLALLVGLRRSRP